MTNESIHSAIHTLIFKRKALGTVSTANVIRELKNDFPNLREHDRELENAIARQAIQNGLQVYFEADMPQKALS